MRFAVVSKPGTSKFVVVETDEDGSQEVHGGAAEMSFSEAYALLRLLEKRHQGPLGDDQAGD